MLKISCPDKDSLLRSPGSSFREALFNTSSSLLDAYEALSLFGSSSNALYSLGTRAHGALGAWSPIPAVFRYVARNRFRLFQWLTLYGDRLKHGPKITTRCSVAEECRSLLVTDVSTWQLAVSCCTALSPGVAHISAGTGSDDTQFS